MFFIEFEGPSALVGISSHPGQVSLSLFLFSRHFVQLRKEELSLHCIDQKEMEAAVPGVKTIDLSKGDAIVSEEDGAGAFSLQTKEAKYL